MMIGTGPYARFGESLNEYLRKRDRSARWLAQRLRVSPSTVTRWLNAETRPQTPESVLAILDVLAVFGREERTKMLEAAGYAVALNATAEDIAEDPQPISQEADMEELAPRGPFLQHQMESVHYVWNDIVDILDWRRFPEHINSWESRLLYGMGKLADAIGPGGFLHILLGVALWAATVALTGPIMAWPLTDPALRAAACIKFVIGLYGLPVLLALLTQPEGMEIFCGKGCSRGKVLLLKLAGAATGFFAFAGVNVFASLTVFYLIGRTPPTWLIALLCLLPPLFAFAAARRIPLDRYYMFKHGIELHQADWWVLMAALVFAPLLAFMVYTFQWMLADRVTGVSVLLAALIFVAWNERRRARRRVKR